MKKPQYKIIKKAWKVSHFNMDYRGYEIIYAVNANQAKSALEKINSDYKYSENYATRSPENDIIELDEYKGTLSNILHKIEQKNRYQKIKDLPDNDTLYVIKNGYIGNALLCWGHNGAGYATIWENIGQYTKSDLLRMFEKGIREQDVIYPVSDILHGLKTIVESQYIKRENRI